MRRSQEAVLKTNLHSLRDAIDDYFRDKGRWPLALEELVKEGYLRTIPEDPVAGARVWQSVPARDGRGLADVKSTAVRPALDGTRYADW